MSKTAFINDPNDGNPWIKITLDQGRCVEKVMTYNEYSSPMETWTCTQSGCNDCDGYQCGQRILTVSVGAGLADQSSEFSCRYGDTVKLEVDNNSGADLEVHEIAIIDKHGK